MTTKRNTLTKCPNHLKELEDFVEASIMLLNEISYDSERIELLINVIGSGKYPKHYPDELRKLVKKYKLKENDGFMKLIERFKVGHELLTEIIALSHNDWDAIPVKARRKINRQWTVINKQLSKDLPWSEYRKQLFSDRLIEYNNFWRNKFYE